MSMKILLKNATVITGEDHAARTCDVGIEGRLISFVGQDDTFVPDRTIYCNGNIVMPGLINAHTHIPMTLLRNYADDYELHTWLFEKIFPAEDKIFPDGIRIGTQLGILEMIRGGTTCFADMYSFEDTIADVVEQTGIKANLSRALLNGDPCALEDDFRFNESVALYEQYHMRDNGRIRIDFALHAVYTSCREYMQAAAEYISRQNHRVHVHVSETLKENVDCMAQYGVSPTRLLYDLGYFRTDTLIAHGVHLSDDDLELLGQLPVSVTHCPSSNLKLASGIARITEYQRRGINVAVGTDGASSNNNLNMLEELHIASILGKGSTLEPTALCAYDTLRMGTVNGAAALGRDDTGLVKAGYAADLAIINIDRPHLTPLGHPLSAIVYSAQHSDVSTVICDGKILMDNGVCTTMDEERVLHDARAFAKGQLT